MITYFCEPEETRDSAVIYQKMLEQAQEIYKTNPEFFGEFCYSCMELALFGKISSDDPRIKLLLKGYEKSVEKARERYELKVQMTEEKQVEELQLREIAKALKNGKTQNQIAAELDVSPSTISYRKNLIYTKHRYLLVSDEYPEPGQF